MFKFKALIESLGPYLTCLTLFMRYLTQPKHLQTQLTSQDDPRGKYVVWPRNMMDFWKHLQNNAKSHANGYTWYEFINLIWKSTPWIDLAFIAITTKYKILPSLKKLLKADLNVFDAGTWSSIPVHYPWCDGLQILAVETTLARGISIAYNESNILKLSQPLAIDFTKPHAILIIVSEYCEGLELMVKDAKGMKCQCAEFRLFNKFAEQLNLYKLDYEDYEKSWVAMYLNTKKMANHCLCICLSTEPRRVNNDCVKLMNKKLTQIDKSMLHDLHIFCNITENMASIFSVTLQKRWPVYFL